MSNRILRKKIAKLNPKAVIARCDLSPRFFCIHATLLCEFESDRYELKSLDRIIADKSHHVIIA